MAPVAGGAYVLIRPRHVPGCTGGYVADTLAAYENHWLYTCNLGELHMYLKSNTLNNATKGANWLKVWTMGQIGYLHNGLFDIINMN